MVRTELSTKLKTSASTQLIQYAGLLNMTNYELLSYVQTQLEENPVLESIQPAQSLSESFIWRGSTGRSSREQHYDGEKDISEWGHEKVDAESLHDHVHEQLLCSSYSQQQIALTEYLCGCLNNCGYLEESCEEIAERLCMEPEFVREAHEILRGLSPAGIGARDLSDCLMLQLKRLEDVPPYAEEIVTGHLQALAESKFKSIAHKLGASLNDVYRASAFIKYLDPKPAARFGSGDKTNYIVPDAIIVNTPAGLDVMINDRWIPGLRMSDYYSELLKTGDEEVKKYLNERFEKARMVMRSIDQRRKTLVVCIKAIVDIQKKFFLGEEKDLAPLSQAELATRLSLNESTLSRAINGKYILCASGMYPLSHFFSRSSYGEGEASRAQSYIISRIVSIIESEEPLKPLSDQAISNRMKAEGIEIARRTVAKYRTEMNILSASERKEAYLCKQAQLKNNN